MASLTEDEDRFDCEEDLEPEEIWKRILGSRGASNPVYQNAFYNFARPVTYAALITQMPFWSAGYTFAYPKLHGFLFGRSNVADPEKRASVRVEDTTSSGKVITRRVHNTLFQAGKTDSLYDVLKSFPLFLEDDRNSKLEFAQRTSPRSTRTLHICNLSPVIIKTILGTSSKWDIPTIAAFMNRHLHGLNWGKVNLHRNDRLGWFSFVFEFHFSFYYVPPAYRDESRAPRDWRNLRKTAMFVADKNGKHRSIYEETSSFLLLGRFDDLATCLQLSDSYYRSPIQINGTGLRTFRPYDPKRGSTQLFLDWLAIVSFHSRSRWDSAIRAIESAVNSPSDVVFANQQERSELMTDNAQFTLSKNYFLALQTYKLFERTLVETIEAWGRFAQESLPKLKGAIVDKHQHQLAIESVEGTIEQLKARLKDVRNGIQDVRDLREGLQATATVFDSRTSLRQGANIRVLTYITIFFLPMTFGTAVFSMQIIPSSSITIHAFAVTISLLTAITFLAVANLHVLTYWFTATATRIAQKLLARMRTHSNEGWKGHARSLEEDKAISQRPVNVAHRSITRWVYVLFMINLLLVDIPIHEISEALCLYGLSKSLKERQKKEDESDTDSVMLDPMIQFHVTFKETRHDFLRRMTVDAQFRKWVSGKVNSKVTKSAAESWMDSMLSKIAPNKFQLLTWNLMNLARLVLLPMWASIILWEYCFLWSVFMLMKAFAATKRAALPSSSAAVVKASVQIPITPAQRAVNLLQLERILPDRSARANGGSTKSMEEGTANGLESRKSQDTKNASKEKLNIIETSQSEPPPVPELVRKATEKWRSSTAPPERELRPQRSTRARSRSPRRPTITGGKASLTSLFGRQSSSKQVGVEVGSRPSTPTLTLTQPKKLPMDHPERPIKDGSSAWSQLRNARDESDTVAGHRIDEEDAHQIEENDVHRPEEDDVHAINIKTRSQAERVSRPNAPILSVQNPTGEGIARSYSDRTELIDSRLRTRPPARIM